MIIRTRRRMIDAAQGAARAGHRCRPASTTRRSTASAPAASILPRSVDWWGGTTELRKAFVKHEGPQALVGCLGY